jgi:uncharacterized Zn finger protein (UPF0148 family)/very-short-patch-repair endonuclease
MLTNKEKIEFLNGLGFTPVSKDLNMNLEVKCRNGHIFKRVFSAFKKGITGCPICEKEEKIRFLNNLGFTPVSEDLSMGLEVKCKKGHVFKRVYSNFKKGVISCPICEKEEKLSFLNSLGFTPVSEDLNMNLEVKCRNGHVFRRVFGNFKQSNIDCPICENEERTKFLNNLGFTPISENLSNNLEVKCKNGHIFKRPYTNFKNGATSCPICEKEEKINFLSSLGFTPISKDLSMNLEVRCEKGHIFKRTFVEFKQGNTSCFICEREERTKFLNDLGFTPISKDLGIDLEVKCKNGHTFKRPFSSFKKDITSCPICEREEKINFLNSLGFTTVSKDLVNNLEVRCEKGHVFKRPYKSFKNGITSCPICENEEKTRFLNDLGFTPVSEYIGKNVEVKCEEGHIFKRAFIEFKKGATKCPICFPNSSSAEVEIEEFLKSLNIEYVHSDWSVLENYELDFYIPSHNLAIEFDGVYWHSESKGKYKNYHLEKTEKYSEKGVNLLHIFENEWINKKDIWKSMIKDSLGLNEKVYANKCILKQVNTSEEEKFLEGNHLQGYVNSQVAFGLYYEDELVSLMSFSKNKCSSDVEWEMLRFASKCGISVIDGELELFRYFRNNYSGGIISYADRRYSNEDIYKVLGFQLSHNSEPNCFYFKHKLVLESRQKYMKYNLPNLLEKFDSNLTEWENMVNNGYNRIWDCGNSVWKLVH